LETLELLPLIIIIFGSEDDIFEFLVSRHTDKWVERSKRKENEMYFIEWFVVYEERYGGYL
jgi:hypothetical protein